MKKIIKKLFNLSGLDIVKHRPALEANMNLAEHLGFELEDEAMDCVRIVKNNTMLSKRRLVTLYQQAAYCEQCHIPGSFVECGVWKGGAMGVMALANLRKGAERRRLHLFDAFTEICEPDAAVDGERAVREVRSLTGRRGCARGKLEPLTGIYDSMGGPGTLEENKELLEKAIHYPPDFIDYHVGWFQDTIPAVCESIGPIAILRLDGDWYASTKVCLEHLFDKVVKGGIVIIDDYGTYEGCRKAVDEFIVSRKLSVYLNNIDDTGRYIIVS
jgi:O-methyltransferase